MEIYIASALHGLGTGLAMPVLGALIVMSVAEDETGAAAGVNNVARTLGGAVGGQVAAVLLVVERIHGRVRASGWSRWSPGWPSRR